MSPKMPLYTRICVGSGTADSLMYLQREQNKAYSCQLFEGVNKRRVIFLSFPKNGEMDRAHFSEDEFPEWIKDAVYSQRRRVHLNGKWAAMDEERAFRYFRKLGRCKKAQIILMSGTYANETRLPMI